MGVPYAVPPVGALRFCAPEECAPWEGVYHADRFGKTCWQEREEKGSFYDVEFYRNADYLTDFDEDCLYLNIWVPGNEGVLEKSVSAKDIPRREFFLRKSFRWRSGFTEGSLTVVSGMKWNLRARSMQKGSNSGNN